MAPFKPDSNAVNFETEFTEADSACSDRSDLLRAFAVKLRQPRNGPFDGTQQIFLFTEPVLGPVPQRAHRF